jgi:hypothetical protein
MALVVVGGHSRSVGKTSVVASLISEMREYEWTAVKITQYGHGICSANGAPCDCATIDHSWAISEENDRKGDSDTSRFLLAGAARALWVRSEQGRLAEAMPGLREHLQRSQHVIMESNSVLKFLRPDLYLTVLDPGTEDFKNSAREFLDRANAVILHDDTKLTDAQWQNVSLKPLSGRRMFRIPSPPYVTPELVEFVREHLGEAAVANQKPATKR